MASVKKTAESVHIHYSCYYTRTRNGEHFVPDHALGYIVSGSAVMDDGQRKTTFNKGDVYFCRRNHFLKYTKVPPEGGEFRSVSVLFSQEVLRDFSLEYGYKPAAHVPWPTFKGFPTQSVLPDYMSSLIAYERLFQQEGTEELFAIKQKEAILLLLRVQPELKEVLFDFSEPGKIDLEAFMSKNFHFNVQLQRFAYLTGRSLATFKRDFEKIFHITPSRWLLQRRLEEAHYLIKEKGKAPSDVYLELGFEDLSHFSFVFKKAYGVAPSKV